MIVFFVLSTVALATYDTNPKLSWLVFGVLVLHTVIYIKITERWARNEKRKNAPLSTNNRRNRE